MLRVAVGVLRDADGRVLLTRRAETAHQGGLWEFPGGKVEAGESVRDALARELAEELGISVTAATPLIRVPYDYGDRVVLLETWSVDTFHGQPAAREGQPLQWVAPADLAGVRMPAANRPIAMAVTLPDRYAITPEYGTARELLAGLERTLAAGVRLLQWRVRRVEDADPAETLRRATTLCHGQGARILENASRPSLDSVDGIHLPARMALRFAARERRCVPGLLAVSCHDPEELAAAVRLGADFAVLSPVAVTPSHPGAAPLGWAHFAEWIAACPLPVYGLGGLDEGDIGDARVAGAQGIAGIRGLWRSDGGSR